MHPAQQISQVFLEILLEIAGGGRLEHLLINASNLLTQTLFYHNSEDTYAILIFIHQVVAIQQNYDDIESHEALELITRFHGHLMQNLPYLFILVDLKLLSIEHTSENAKSEILNATNNLQGALPKNLQSQFIYSHLQETIDNLQNKIKEHVSKTERQTVLESLDNLRNSYLNVQSPPKIKHY